MTIPTVRQMSLLHLVWCLGCWSISVDSYPSPFKQWEDGITLTKVPDIQRNDDMGNMMWRDHEEQVQNVFKRFLFHYSKAHNSVGAVQHESHSVHPLMRLSPKLSQRRKKQLVLMGLRALPEGSL